MPGFNDVVHQLRGIAILAVIGYHLDLGLFSYGFLGVDVFFVLSGYLAYNSIQNYGSWFFLKSRFWRLFPSLVVLLSTVSLFSFFVLRFSDYFENWLDAVRSVLFVSNFFLYFDVGYFEPAAKRLLYLHTWSLSTEFQFYVALAVVYAALRYVPARMHMGFILAVSLISLSGYLLVVEYNYSLAFYFSPLRFWEFSIGVLVAGGRYWYSLVFYLLVCLLNFGGITNVEYFRIMVVLFSALAIFLSWSIPLGWFERFVAWNAKISYSLYLVHWPVFVLVDYLYDSFWSIPIKIVLAYGLGVLLWRTVETQFQYSLVRKNP